MCPSMISCVHMCAWMCICAYTCVQVYACVCICTCVCMHVPECLRAGWKSKLTSPSSCPRASQKGRDAEVHSCLWLARLPFHWHREWREKWAGSAEPSRLQSACSTYMPAVPFQLTPEVSRAWGEAGGRAGAGGHAGVGLDSHSLELQPWRQSQHAVPGLGPSPGPHHTQTLHVLHVLPSRGRRGSLTELQAVLGPGTPALAPQGPRSPLPSPPQAEASCQIEDTSIPKRAEPQPFLSLTSAGSCPLRRDAPPASTEL